MYHAFVLSHFFLPISLRSVSFRYNYTIEKSIKVNHWRKLHHHCLCTLSRKLSCYCAHYVGLVGSLMLLLFAFCQSSRYVLANLTPFATAWFKSNLMLLPFAVKWELDQWKSLEKLINMSNKLTTQARSLKIGRNIK